MIETVFEGAKATLEIGNVDARIVVDDKFEECLEGLQWVGSDVSVTLNIGGKPVIGRLVSDLPIRLVLETAGGKRIVVNRFAVGYMVIHGIALPRETEDGHIEWFHEESDPKSETPLIAGAKWDDSPKDIRRDLAAVAKRCRETAYVPPPVPTIFVSASRYAEIKKRADSVGVSVDQYASRMFGKMTIAIGDQSGE